LEVIEVDPVELDWTYLEDEVDGEDWEDDEDWDDVEGEDWDEEED